MKINYIVAFCVIHWLLSFVAYLVLYGLGLSLQDAGSASGVLAWLEWPLRYGLLQPVAHWAIDSAVAAAWTWSGLVVTAMLVAVNSIVVSAVLAAFVLALRLWRSRRQDAKIRRT